MWDTMINSAAFWWVILIAYVCFTLWDWIKSYRKKRLFYAMKQSANGLQFLIALVGVLYFVIVAVTFLPTFAEWWNSRNVASTIPLGTWLLSRVPLVYSIGVFLVVIRVMWWMQKPMIKYNDQEKIWNQESNARLRDKLPNWMRGLIKVEKSN